MVPQRMISHYRIIDSIDKGGMGEVYLAEDTRYQSRVALKIISKSLAENQKEEVRKRFDKEAKSLGRLRDNENICKIFDVDEADGCAFIAMEYVEGQTLKTKIEQSSIDLEQCLDIAVQIADALAYAHSKDIIHRDIKPANIMITKRRVVKVLDFGIAKIIRSDGAPEDGAEELTEPGKPIGTVVYMSPEQINGEKLDCRSDIFSFGILLYEMATGRRPFSGSTLIEIILERSKDNPPPLAQFRDGLPSELQEIVSKALRKERESRYQSIEDLACDLKALMQRLQKALTPEKEQSPPGKKEPHGETKPDGTPFQLQQKREGGDRNPEESEDQVNPQPLDPPLPGLSIKPVSKPIQSTVQRKLQRLLLAVGSLLVLALVVYAVYRLLNPRIETPPPLPPPREVQSNFVFAKLNGLVIERSNMVADSLTQEMGNGVILEMIKIPKGRFLMGTSNSDFNKVIAEYWRYNRREIAEPWARRETPQREVTISEFYMGKFEVTQDQWRIVANWDRVRIDLNPDLSNGNNLPVVMVSWEEAVEFCERLSRRTGRKYRLPSEAEWEYACRAGSQTPFHFGEVIVSKVANYNGTMPYGGLNQDEYKMGPTVVGSFGIANKYGLFDMHGNVWEWCQDAWHENYNGAPTDGSPWEINGEPGLRVIRGGSWLNSGPKCRSASREKHLQEGEYIVGFRVVCEKS